ncbi:MULTISPECIES: hypothetical protein [Actinomadura]|uniref:Secreted protein n=1 Tax=Actinomadura yumaensis TaxID=111807 RepID=A0ABW2CUE4_9ACTN|nr:hypothetical protein [Actinomadura sp. J1-007]MWK37542.1 hypothetical protein [Actinomadura sp. J1-007]
MKALVRRLGTPTLAAFAAIGLTAAAAAATTVHRDTLAGPNYDGPYQITNLGNMTFAGGGFSASCTGADLRGTLTHTGSGTLDSASVTGCTSSMGAVTVTFLNLPYTQGTLTHNPIAGGRDGTLTFTDPKLSIRASFSLGSCTYGFGGSINSLTFSVFNRDNGARPNPADEFQGQMINASLTKTGGPFFCPTGVQANGVGKARGKVNPGDAAYNQKLYLGP